MKFASEILILFLMILCNGRVFIVKKPEVDALVMLSPVAFILAILHFFAFGIDLFSLLILFVALLVLLSNFHALFRFSSRLIVDSYSPLMIVWAIFTTLLSAAVFAGVICFGPLELKNGKLGILETDTALSGNFMGGFMEAEKFTIADAYLFEFAPNPNSIDKVNNVAESENTESSNPSDSNPNTISETPATIIIFMPDKRGDTENYKPYLQYLAQLGYTCYSADFFARDLKWLHAFGDRKIIRRLALIIESLTDNQKFMSQREFYTYNFSKEFSAMIDLLDEKYGKDCGYFFVTDILGFDAASDIQKKRPEKVTGIFDISKVESYKTAGYGFIEQTDPLLAYILGEKRDVTFKAAKDAAEKTKAAIDSINIPSDTETDAEGAELSE